MSSNSDWALATKLFGDPKRLMPERTERGDRKSYALRFLDTVEDFWSVVRGLPVDGKRISVEDKREFLG
jgi:hypothetical protein